MLLAIDIGNSAIKFGIYDGDNLIKKFSVPTIRDRSTEHLDLETLVNAGAAVERDISRVIVSSVVPELDAALAQACEQGFELTPIFIDSTSDLGLKISYEPPASVGVDRLMAAFSSSEKYGTPCIVCDFGTATTIDAVGSGREYLGGTITPGMKTMAMSLVSGTSKLPAVSIELPERAIGNSTIQSIRSGIFFGYMGFVEGIIGRIASEVRGEPRVVATGGFASLIAANCDAIDVVDEDLILDGLRTLSKRIDS